MKYSVETARGTFVYSGVTEATIAYDEAREDRSLKWGRLVALEEGGKAREVASFRREKL